MGKRKREEDRWAKATEKRFKHDINKSENDEKKLAVDQRFDVEQQDFINDDAVVDQYGRKKWVEGESSSSEESSSVEVSSSSEEEEIIAGNPAKRLAIVNISWDHVSAKDLLAVFRSFDSGGVVKNVTVYVSDFGKVQMEKDKLHGPAVFNENGRVSMKKLKKFEKNKLKYYFAIAECDRPSTSASLYNTLDGIEMESIAMMDLRYVPDEIDFTGREIKDRCSDLNQEEYDPSILLTHTSNQNTAKVKLTWDQNDIRREKITKRSFNITEINEDDYKAYLESVSEEGSDDEAINKYRSLLGGNSESEEEEAEGKVLNITFTSGLAEKATNILKNKDKEDESVFKKQLNKIRDKKKKPKNTDADNFTFDPEDPFADWDDADFEADEKKASRRSKKKEQEAELTQEQKDELELLVFDPSKNEKMVQEDPSLKKKKKKRRKKKVTFTVDVDKERFGALFDNPDFQRDPTHKNYDVDNPMNKVIIKEKIKHRRNKKKTASDEKKSDDVSSLINSLKKKTELWEKSNV
eukprot:TRINITY_DN6990_c0_g1_i1.p1 TRINITY_DN6990_c0_g1~~TRINITY_DN6990_c0_g1_i1.p1  ORF type:complete len:523 (-),score=181.29 TRINITY_DN6990_c0_g1_i1:1062-2630(-)